MFCFLGSEDIKTKIMNFLATAVFVFIAAGVLFAHLNHYLDPNQPIKCPAVIENKSYTSDSEGSDDYLFTLTYNGNTFYIGVSKEDFYTMEEGDLYVIEYHQGAFNEPYYMVIGTP